MVKKINTQKYFDITRTVLVILLGFVHSIAASHWVFVFSKSRKAWMDGSPDVSAVRVEIREKYALAALRPRSVSGKNETSKEASMSSLLSALERSLIGLGG